MSSSPRNPIDSARDRNDDGRPHRARVIERFLYGLDSDCCHIPNYIRFRTVYLSKSSLIGTNSAAATAVISPPAEDRQADFSNAPLPRQPGLPRNDRWGTGNGSAGHRWRSPNGPLQCGIPLGTKGRKVTGAAARAAASAAAWAWLCEVRRLPGRGKHDAHHDHQPDEPQGQHRHRPAILHRFYSHHRSSPKIELESTEEDSPQSIGQQNGDRRYPPDGIGPLDRHPDPSGQIRR